MFIKEHKLEGTNVSNSLTTDVKDASSREAFKRLLSKERNSVEKLSFEKVTVVTKKKILKTLNFF